jgi:hypothetical protein
MANLTRAELRQLYEESERARESLVDELARLGSIAEQAARVVAAEQLTDEGCPLRHHTSSCQCHRHVEMAALRRMLVEHGDE